MLGLNETPGVLDPSMVENARKMALDNFISNKPETLSRPGKNSIKKNLLLASKLLNPPALQPEAKFKEFERQLKFKLWLNYGWFHLKLYSMLQDLSRRSIKTGFWRI